MLSETGLSVDSSTDIPSECVFAEISGIQRHVCMKKHSFLRAGGYAEWLYEAYSVEDLVKVVQLANNHHIPVTLLGSGSNVLVSETGIKGLVVINRCREINIHDDNTVVADCGILFQDLFLKTVHAGLSGLEFAVGIPGTLGGALVSNAGAYRNNISSFVESIEILENGSVSWVGKEWMEFSYRDSKLRGLEHSKALLLRAKLRLSKGNREESIREARDYQVQRILKQPRHASAGSFFKNVYSSELANELESLPESLKKAGVVPAGFLIMEAGLAGFRYGGAMLTKKHANFMTNVGGASASDIRYVAEHAKRVVFAKFRVKLEEEVLYIGNWN